MGKMAGCLLIKIHCREMYEEGRMANKEQDIFCCKDASGELCDEFSAIISVFPKMSIRLSC